MRDGVLASLLRLLEVLAFGNSTSVFQVELACVLLIEISHEDLQSLILGLVDFSVCKVSSELLRVIQNLGGGLSLGGGRRSELGVGTSNIEVPVLAVHLSDHVGTASHESLVKELDLVAPAAVRTTLLVRVEEVLATVEDAMRSGGGRNGGGEVGLDTRETGLEGSNFKHSRQAVQQSGGTAGLEHELVGEDKHAGLGEEVGVHVSMSDNRENLAVHKIKHLFPSV